MLLGLYLTHKCFISIVFYAASLLCSQHCLNNWGPVQHGNEGSLVQKLRISRQQQQNIKPSAEPFCVGNLWAYPDHRSMKQALPSLPTNFVEVTGFPSWRLTSPQWFHVPLPTCWWSLRALMGNWTTRYLLLFLHMKQWLKYLPLSHVAFCVPIYYWNFCADILKSSPVL